MALRDLRTTDTRWRIAVINGPNMPNLGQRDKRSYGTIASIDELDKLVTTTAENLGVEVENFASNHEGDILDFIHRKQAEDVDAYMMNPGGITTGSDRTRRALQETFRPSLELHFTNIATRFGAWSTLTRTAIGTVMGLRQYGYVGGMIALVMSLDDDTFLGPNDSPGPWNRTNGLPWPAEW